MNCDHSDTFNSDYLQDGELVENRHCLRCGTHWHKGKEYTRQEWDACLEESK